jgi:hypothetical protein
MGMMKSQIAGAATQMKLNHTQAKMVESMAGAANAMGKMNEAVDPAKMMKMMAEFARENEMMDTKQEMMDEALDGLFDDDVIEGEADAVTEQVPPKAQTRRPPTLKPHVEPVRSRSGQALAAKALCAQTGLPAYTSLPKPETLVCPTRLG